MRVAPQQLGQVTLQALEKRGVVNDAVFDDLGEAGAKLAPGQAGQRIQIAQHQARLVEGADEVLAGLQVHAHLAADGAVHLRQQRRGHLHERDAAQIGSGHEARQVAHHAAAERDDE